MITLSFIIPTLNEERNIGNTIDKIVKNTGVNWSYEIIVVDNGSTDNTVSVARLKNTKILTYPNVAVSVLRNKGAFESAGEVLVFIDGDISVTPGWGKELNKVIKQLQGDPLQVNGSICGTSEQSSWLEKNWFDPSLRRKAPCYINSGHLIVPRTLFYKVGGFDENLETGEDVDFCERAKSNGARIVLNPILSVIHEGFPKTLFAFFKREKWHARGDYSSWKKLQHSKPALISVFLLLMLVLNVIVSVQIWQVWPLGLYIGLFATVCFASSIYRFGITSSQWIKGGPVYAVYFAARAFSFLEMIFLQGKVSNR